MKKRQKIIAALSICGASHARLFDRVGGDVIVVGDSAAMTEEGRPNTKSMTMDRMVAYCQAVRNGTRRCFVVGDMPLGSYEISDECAVTNAKRFMQDADCNAVKMEVNEFYIRRIEAVAQFCLVVAHIGLNPNKAEMLGGYRTQGRTLESVRELCRVARAAEKAGACMILIESVAEEVSQMISRLVSVPVLGIAAGRNLHGQLLISADWLGLYEWPGNVKPKHFDTYKADQPGATIGDLTLKAFQRYVELVQSGEFPGEENVHFLPEGERLIIESYLRKEWTSSRGSTIDTSAESHVA